MESTVRERRNGNVHRGLGHHGIDHRPDQRFHELCHSLEELQRRHDVRSDVAAQL